jgi:hypothetical protein
MQKRLIAIVSALGLTVSGCATDGIGYIDSSLYYSPPIYYEPSPVIITTPPIIYREHHREPAFRPYSPPIRQHSPPAFRPSPPIRQHSPPAFRNPGSNIHRGRR